MYEYFEYLNGGHEIEAREGTDEWMDGCIFVFSLKNKN